METIVRLLVGAIAILAGLSVIWRVFAAGTDDEGSSKSVPGLVGVSLAVVGAVIVGSAFAVDTDEEIIADIVLSNPCDFVIVVSDGETPLGAVGPGESDRIAVPQAVSIYVGASLFDSLEIDATRLPLVELSINECALLGSMTR